MRNLVILGVVGLVAQLVDGSLGMGFGVTSSTLLIAAGIAPAMASASIHFSEVGTTLISGFAHHRWATSTGAPWASSPSRAGWAPSSVRTSR